jgi:type III pantothenate kinase
MGLCLARSLLVSVRTAEETDALILAIEREFGISVVCAKSSREMSGVKNGYEDYERLGLDRWLAMLGGFHLASGSACLVLDFGTAVTADFIAADGEHLGGFICPGCH